LATALGVERVVVSGVTIEDGALVLAVWPVKAERRRCSRCGIRCPGYDSGSGTRRWRAQDIGQNTAILHTIVANCVLAGVNPQEYLADVLIRVQSHPANRIAELTPERWKAARAEEAAAAKA